MMDNEKINQQELEDNDIEDVTGGGMRGLEKLSAALKQSVRLGTAKQSALRAEKQSGTVKQSAFIHPGSAQYGDYVGYCADCKCDVFTMTEPIHKNHHLITGGCGR